MSHFFLIRELQTVNMNGFELLLLQIEFLATQIDVNVTNGILIFILNSSISWHSSLNNNRAHLVSYRNHLVFFGVGEGLSMV